MLNLRWILLVLFALSLSLNMTAAVAQPASANHCQPSMTQMMPSDASMQDCKACATDVNHCSICVSALPLMPLQSVIFAADAIQIAAPVVIFQSLTSPPLLPPPVFLA
ncbi:hypothetical protein [Deefgea rivuli]|uniref:hypothetical protein n=1 Tax=Deefgea rivuli TaxID=400948 RepID=UPI00048745A9|nr:hypothetical protein [Deefgea rivuli]